MSDYIENGEWEMVSIPVEAKDKKYNCCSNPFAEITYKFQMRRKVLYYLFNLILPCTIISTLAVLAFCISPQSGQRITLSITVMLAMSVFLNFAWSRLPVTSDSVPLLAKYYMVTMTVIGLSLFANCATLNYFYRDDALSYLPKCFRINFIAWLAKTVSSLFCMKYPTLTNQYLMKTSRNQMGDKHAKVKHRNKNGPVDNGKARNANNCTRVVMDVDNNGEKCNVNDYESVVMISDSEGKIKLKPKSQVSHSDKMKRKKQNTKFKRLVSNDVFEHTSTHALVAEAKEHYVNYKELRKRREEDDVDVLIANNIEKDLLKELEDHKQFTAMIIDRFFLISFVFAFVLSMTALLSGDTAKFTAD